MKRIDLTGRRFGNLVVQGFEGSWAQFGGSVRAYWKTLCDCGSERVIASADLLAGRIKACKSCVATDARERKRAAEERAQGKSVGGRPPLTAEQRRNNAQKAQAAMTGEGQKYMRHYKAYRDKFTRAQWTLYHQVLRGRTGAQVEAEAVDVVLREMPPVEKQEAA
jgi:hypothetical protein